MPIENTPESIFSVSPSNSHAKNMISPLSGAVDVTASSFDKQRITFRGWVTSSTGVEYYATGSRFREGNEYTLQANLIQVDGDKIRLPYIKIASKFGIDNQGAVYKGTLTSGKETLGKEVLPARIKCRFLDF